MVGMKTRRRSVAPMPSTLPSRSSSTNPRRVPACAEVDRARALGALGGDGADGGQGGGPLGGEDAAVAHVAQREGAVAGHAARADRDALERLAAQRLDRVAPEGGDGAEGLAH